MWAQILCYKNQGIHWYHCNPTFLWQINFRLVRRLISALIWDISGLWNRSDSRDYREKRIAISRFLALYLRVCGLLLTGMFVFRSRTETLLWGQSWQKSKQSQTFYMTMRDEGVVGFALTDTCDGDKCTSDNKWPIEKKRFRGRIRNLLCN